MTAVDDVDFIAGLIFETVLGNEMQFSFCGTNKSFLSAKEYHMRFNL